MGLAHWLVMRMLMMIVMSMDMVVFQRLVEVVMVMPLRQVQP